MLCLYGERYELRGGLGHSPSTNFSFAFLFPTTSLFLFKFSHNLIPINIFCPWVVLTTLFGDAILEVRASDLRYSTPPSSFLKNLLRINDSGGLEGEARFILMVRPNVLLPTTPGFIKLWRKEVLGYWSGYLLKMTRIGMVSLSIGMWIMISQL